LGDKDTHEDKVLSFIQAAKCMREEFAPGLRDFYNANISAGFTEDQAMELTKTWLSSIVQLCRKDFP